MEYTKIIIFLLGLASGFFGGVVGGTGMLNLPILMWLGLPPHIAIGTHKFGALMLAPGSLHRYIKANKIHWKFAASVSILSVLAAIIGPRIAFAIPADTLGKIIPILILALLPVVLYKQKIGMERKETNKFMRVGGHILYFAAALVQGAVSSGFGMIVFYTFIYFFGLTYLEAAATKKIPGFIITLVSFIAFAMQGFVNFELGIFLVVGMFTGSNLGSHYAVKNGNPWVRNVFALLVVVSSLRILFKQFYG